MRHARLALLVSVALQAACVGVTASFPCEASSQCVQGGVPGTCESSGFCSFPDPTCPSGSRYAAHASADLAATCTSAGEPDGGGDDSAEPDADPSACGGTRLLADDFEDGVVFGPLWGGSFDNGIARGAPPLLAEQGGKAVLTYLEGIAEPVYAEYRSTRTYDLRGDRVFLEVLTTPNPTTLAQADLGVTLADGRRIDIAAEHGDLIFLYQDPARVNVGTAPLTAADRWWQIRESGGMIIYETSEDGVSFVNRAMVATPFDVSSVTVIFGGGTYRAEVDPGTATFDNLNGGTPSGRECP